MATPLLMLGPGGDYTSRYFVQGVSLAKRPGSAQSHDPQGESAGGFAGYHRQRASPAEATYADAGVGAPRLTQDVFEHGTAVTAGTYSAGKPRTAPAPATLPAASVAAAAEAWLAAQHRTLIAIPLFTPAAPSTHSATGHHPQRTAPRPSPVACRTATTGPWPRAATAAGWLAPSLVTESAYAQPPIESDLVTTAIPSSVELHHEPHAETAAHPHPHPRPAAGPGLLPHHAGAGRRAEREQGHGLRARRGAHQKGSALARPQQGSLFNG